MQTKRSTSPARFAWALFTGLALTLLTGCLADTAEDTALPWASSKGWEGIAPISPTVMDRYE